MTFALLQPLVIAVLVVVEVAVFQLRVALAGKGSKRIATVDERITARSRA